MASLNLPSSPVRQLSLTTAQQRGAWSSFNLWCLRQACAYALYKGYGLVIVQAPLAQSPFRDELQGLPNQSTIMACESILDAEALIDAWHINEGQKPLWVIVLG